MAEKANWTTFTEEQVQQILRLAATGLKPVDLCGRFGVPMIIFRSWQARYGMPDMARESELVRQLEEENQRLKRLVADLTLEVRNMQMRLEAVGEATPRSSSSSNGRGDD